MERAHAMEILNQHDRATFAAYHHRSATPVLSDLVGRAPAFDDVLAKLPVVARADDAVLVTGETGTGKDLVARAIHELGPRARGPVVSVSCGSLVDTRLEDELFGHERGPGDDPHARGLVSRAAGGTLFLDEAETLTPRAQIALLRVLQDRTFRAVGSTVEQRVDVRFVAATSAGLEHMVQAGTFRADLYYRLCVFSIYLLPLRDRREDILPLAAHFLEKHGRPGGKLQLSPGAVEALLAFDWPGNVRELENTIVRAVNHVIDGVVHAGDLGLGPHGASHVVSDAAGTPQSYKSQKRRFLEAFERQYLTRLMTEHLGNVTHAARAAGKERRDLGKLLKRHGFDPRQFASRASR